MPWSCFFICFHSVIKSCPTHCDPMGCSTSGSLVHHQLLKLAQTHVHRVSGAMQPSHYSLLPPSIFPSIRVFSNESILRIRWPKYWSFSFSINLSNEYSGFISFKVTGLISLQSKELSRVFSNTRIQSINSSALSLLYGPTLTSIHHYWKSHSFNYRDLCRQNNVSFLICSLGLS